MLVWKAIAAEFKAERQPSYVIWDINLRCLRGNRPAHNTIAQLKTKGTSIKNPRVEDPRPKPHEPKAEAPQHYDNIKTFKKTQKEKKKKDRHNRRDWQPWDQERLTPTTGVNVTDLTWRSYDNQPWKADRTLPRSPFIIITKKTIMQIVALSHQSQKTSINLGNLRGGDWC